MAVFTIAGLTIKEAIRRRTLFGALLMGLLVLALSLMLVPIQTRNEHRLVTGHMDIQQYALATLTARSVVMSLCLSSIKSLGALFAALLAGGAISGEIESGLMAVILPKPIPRWQILLGKWIGINLILVVSTLVWTLMVWTSFNAQVSVNVSAILRAGPLLALFPVLLSTLTLAISTVAPRLFGTVIAMTIGVFAWFDGIFNALGRQYDVAALQRTAEIAGLVAPQGYVGWWVERAMGDLLMQATGPRGFGAWQSPQFLNEWGMAHLHFAHLDVVYFVFYLLIVFLVGALLFQRRDV